MKKRLFFVAFLLSLLFNPAAKAIQGINDVPVGWFHIYNQGNGTTSVDFNYVKNSPALLDQENQMLQDSYATIIMNLQMPIGTLTNYDLLEGTNIQVISDYYDVNPNDGLSYFLTGYGTFDHLWGTRFRLDPQDFNADFMPGLKDIFTRVTQWDASSEHFGGYWVGEEPLRYANMDLTETQNIFDNMETFYTEVTPIRNGASSKPIITGSNVQDCFFHGANFDAQNNPSYLGHGPESRLLSDYGKVRPTHTASFFEEAPYFDVYYDYKSPTLGSIGFYNSDDDGGANYQSRIQTRLFYSWKWAADKVYRTAVNADGGKEKEFWVMLMPTRRTHVTVGAGGSLTPDYDMQRAWTRTEMRMGANLAMACGAKGILMYRLSGHDLDWQLARTPTGGDFMFEFGFRDHRRDTINHLQPWSNRFDGDHPSTIFPPYGDAASCETDDYPFDYASDLFDPNSTTSIIPSLKLLRQMEWINTTNAHPKMLNAVIDTNLFITSYDYDFDFSMPSYPGYTAIDRTITDEVRIGTGSDRFHLSSVTGSGMVLSTHDYYDETQGTSGADSMFYYNSNIYTGLFKWRNEDPDAEYYYVVNSRCNQGTGGAANGVGIGKIDPPPEEDVFQIVDADDAEIMMNFDKPTTGTWILTDRVTGEVLTGTQSATTISTVLFDLEPGEGRLIKLAPSTAGEGGLHMNQTINWSGTIHLTSNMIMDGGTLNIAPGTSVIVEGNYAIQLTDGAKINAIGGTGDDMISFRPAEELEPNSWQGIYIYDDTNYITHYLDHCQIQGAVIGVGLAAGDGTNQTVRIQNSEISYCTTGMVNVSGPRTYLQNTHIVNCGTAVHWNNTSEYYYCYGNMIEDNGRGIYVQDGYRVLIYGNTIQENGQEGLEVQAADYVYLRRWSTTGAHNLIRYNGHLNPQAYPGVSLGSTLAYYYDHTYIVENKGPGLQLGYGFAMTGRTGNEDNAIANNALSVPIPSGASEVPDEKTEIYAWGDGVLELNTSTFDLFKHSAYMPNTSPDWDQCYPNLYITAFNSDTWTMNGNYWGETVDDPGDVVSTYTIRNNAIPPAVFNVTNVETNPTTSDYWQTTISSVTNRPEQRLSLAYDLLNEQEKPEEAEHLFRTLLFKEHYQPAMRGWMEVMLRLEHSISEIEQTLRGTFQTQEELISIDFLVADYWRRHGDYDKSREIYQAISQSKPGSTAAFSARLRDAYLDLALVVEKQFDLVQTQAKASEHRKTARENAQVLEQIRQIKQEMHNAASLEQASENLPTDFKIANAYPNPFNPSIRLEITLPKKSDLQVQIYNVLGERVATLYEGIQQAGVHHLEWNGQTSTGNTAASGLYLVKMRAGNQHDLKKIIMVK